MTRKALLFTAIFLILATVVFVVATVEIETVTTPEILITITPDKYIINDRASNDVVSLLTDEIKSRKFIEPFNIILSANKEIQYQRIVGAMDVLKNNGFESIGLNARE